MEFIFEIVFSSSVIGSRGSYPIGLAPPGVSPRRWRVSVVKRRRPVYVIAAPCPVSTPVSCRSSSCSLSTILRRRLNHFYSSLTNP